MSWVTVRSESYVDLLSWAVAQLSTCHCYEKYLNLVSSPSPVPQLWHVGSIFRDLHSALHPIADRHVFLQLFFSFTFQSETSFAIFSCKELAYKTTEIYRLKCILVGFSFIFNGLYFAALIICSKLVSSRMVS